MTRRGKIARLPREIREQLNRRIQDGKPGNRLVTWLNSLQKVKAVLRTEFHSQPINAPNLSDWMDGGYRDWLIQQETVDLLHLMQDNSDELTQAANRTRLSDLLAHRLAARIVLLTQRLDQSTADGPPDQKLLSQLCADVVALRKGDHSAERLKLARDRLNVEHEPDSRDLGRDDEEIARKWAKEHGREIINKRTPEELEQRYREIFGIDDDYKFPTQAAPARPRHMGQSYGQNPETASPATTEQPEGSPPGESPSDPNESNQ